MVAGTPVANSNPLNSFDKAVFINTANGNPALHVILSFSTDVGKKMAIP